MGCRQGTASNTAGDVGAGDPIELLHRPNHGVTIGTVERAYHGDHQLRQSLVHQPELSTAWRNWAARALAR
jgi:MOSC domain-containing protein YiiM